jgi:N-acetylglutamate synthase-like GNAT family acetyltransferase
MDVKLSEKFFISSDRSKLDLAIIHGFLRQSYWAKNIPLETVQRSIQNSLCFGIYENCEQAHKQVGFARVITDYAVIAYLADVFILKPYQGQRLGKHLIQHILNEPDLQGLRKWLLVTGDAHEFYQKIGFQALKGPENYMEIINLTNYGSD